MSRLSFSDDFVRKAMDDARDSALTAAAMVCADECVLRFGSNHGGVPSKPGGYPHSQTGRLRAAIYYVSPFRAGTPGKAAYGTNVPYGRFLQHGATVTAKRVKFLPIPINKQAQLMLRKASVSGGLRSFRMKVVVQGGKAYLMEQTARGKAKKNGAVFVLKKSVRIAPRPWINLPGDGGYKQRASAAAGAAFKARLREYAKGGA